MKATDLDNSERREAFANRLVGDLLASMEILGVWLGLRLGLYAALDRAGASNAAELASKAGIDTRYAREWLEQQAVAGVLVTTDAGEDAGDRLYELPSAHREVLLDEVSPYFVAPASYALAGIARVLPELLTAYRTGAKDATVGEHVTHCQQELVGQVGDVLRLPVVMHALWLAVV